MRYLRRDFLQKASCLGLQNLTECKVSEKSWWETSFFDVSMFKLPFFFIWIYFMEQVGLLEFC